MNEQQHDTLREVNAAKRQVELAELQLFEAKHALARARQNHTRAVQGDRASWEATPNVTRLEGATGD